MVRLRSWSFYVIVMAMISQAGLAQPANRKVVDQPLEWFAVTTNWKLNKRLTYMLEGQFRYVSGFQPQQYQLRTALDIGVNGHLSIVPLGYVYTWNYKYGKQPVSVSNNEHRLWEQVSYKHHVGRLHISHRLRLEQRFIQVHALSQEGGLINEGYDMHQNRLRYRFMATVPLNHTRMQTGTYYVCAWDEAFLSRGDNVTFHEPDQNRLFAGVGKQVTSKLTIQGGFLYQMLIKANGAMQENNIGVQLQLTYAVDLTLKEN